MDGFENMFLHDFFQPFGSILISMIALHGTYTGTANNAGAILVLGRDLVVVPKLIHPFPPAITSPENSPEHHIEDTWMQVTLYRCKYISLFELAATAAVHLLTP